MLTCPHYFFHAGLDPLGVAFELDWKAVGRKLNDASNEDVTWELRRIVKSLYSDRKDIKLAQILYNERAEWTEKLLKVGLKWDDEFYMNERAAKSRKLVITAEHDDQHRLSTRSALALMMVWTEKRLDKHSKRACGMLDVFLSNALHAIDCSRLLFFNPLPAEATDKCAIGRGDGECCRCVLQFFVDNASCQTLAPGFRASQLLQALYPLPLCCALLVWFCLCLDDLARLLDSGISAYTSPNPLDVPSAKILMTTSSGHKMAVDTHYKEAVATEVRVKKLAMTAGAFCQAHSSAAGSTASQWEEQATSRLVAAGLLSVKDIGTLWLPSDGLRVGRPAEETLVIACWDQRSDYGFALAPQVFERNTYGPLRRLGFKIVEFSYFRYFNDLEFHSVFMFGAEMQ